MTAENIILMIGIAIGVIGTLAAQMVLLPILWLLIREREDDDE